MYIIGTYLQNPQVIMSYENIQHVIMSLVISFNSYYNDHYIVVINYVQLQYLN